MPKNKDFKRLVRSRMEKTGESYTTARAQLLTKRDQRKKSERETARPATPVDPAGYADLAGMSDEAVSKRTGKTWEEWVRTLDDRDAASQPHREIAAAVKKDFGLTAWWAQTVTVGYERIKGLRDVGQQRDGTYEANKSKTYRVPIGRLYRAFGDPDFRERWLPGVELTVRTATEEKSMRITWEDETSVAVYFIAKGDSKCQVSVQHTKLASRDELEARKAYWAERLTALGEVLEREGAVDA